MADPELRRMLKLSRALMITALALYIPLVALLTKTLQEGEAFLRNSDRMLELVREYQQQRRTPPKPMDIVRLVPEPGRGDPASKL